MYSIKNAVLIKDWLESFRKLLCILNSHLFYYFVCKAFFLLLLLPFLFFHLFTVSLSLLYLCLSICMYVNAMRVRELRRLTCFILSDRQSKMSLLVNWESPLVFSIIKLEIKDAQRLKVLVHSFEFKVHSLKFRV